MIPGHGREAAPGDIVLLGGTIHTDRPDRLRITIADAADMPDVAIHTIEGFVNAIGEQSAHVVHLHWTGRRTEPGTMDASVAAVYGSADT